MGGFEWRPFNRTTPDMTVDQAAAIVTTARRTAAPRLSLAPFEVPPDSRGRSNRRADDKHCAARYASPPVRPPGQLAHRGTGPVDRSNPGLPTLRPQAASLRNGSEALFILPAGYGVIARVLRSLCPSVLGTESGPDQMPPPDVN